jgi:hypothetical protein
MNQRLRLYDRTVSDTLDFVKIHRYLGVSVPDEAIVAVVAPSLVGYGLASMWEIHVSDVGWVTKVFKAKSEAESWVKEKMKELFDTDISFAK